MAAGISVVTPNKRLGSGPEERYIKVLELTRRTRARFLAEACLYFHPTYAKVILLNLFIW
jgi:hypothetical protein